MLRTNVNKIWSDVVKEETLCETLLKLSTPTNDGTNEATTSNSRDIESYHYKSPVIDDEKFKSQRHVRRGKRSRSGQQKLDPQMMVSELDSEEAVVLAIVKHLREPKVNIISDKIFLVYYVSKCFRLKADILFSIFYFDY